MTIRDLAAQVASLANDYGATHGPHSPATFKLALYLGDPTEDGIEVPATTTVVNEDTGEESVVSNGYAAATVANNGTNFPAPDPTTGVLTSAVVAFPTSTAEYPDTVTHWLLSDASTGVGWDTGALSRDEQITIEAAGVTPRLLLSLFYNPLS